MKKIKLAFIIFYVIFIGLLFNSVSCKKEPEVIPTVNAYSLSIHVSHMFGDKPLQFNTNYYTAAGDTIRISSQFAYYLTNVKLTTTSGITISPETYFLITYDIDSEDPSSGTVVINNLPKATYGKISFMIGVDSLHNHSTARTGGLDPANSMFWPWNTGYIFYRITGHYNAANTPFGFDIGGDENVMKFDFPATIQLDKNRTINLKMDVKELFENPNIYDLKTDDNSIHNTTATGLVKLVPNAKDMMSVTSVQ